jgi:hypothetical protein
MSLKSFHIVYAILTTVLFTFLTIFCLNLYKDTDKIMHLIFAFSNLFFVILGILYCRRFLIKYKSISYL